MWTPKGLPSGRVRVAKGRGFLISKSEQERPAEVPSHREIPLKKKKDEHLLKRAFAKKAFGLLPRGISRRTKFPAFPRRGVQQKRRLESCQDWILSYKLTVRRVRFLRSQAPRIDRSHRKTAILSARACRSRQRIRSCGLFAFADFAWA